MYCSKCGEKFHENANFCHVCSDAEQPLSVPPRSKPINETEEDRVIDYKDAIKIFVQNKSDYYSWKWTVIDRYNKKRNWNWPAFFFSPLWLGYRKMYQLLWIIILIWILFDSLIYFYGVADILVLNFIRFVTSIIIGLFGNYFYYQFSKRRIEKSRAVDGKYDVKLIRSYGGTSKLGVFISIFSLICYALISSLIYIVINENNFTYHHISSEVHKLDTTNEIEFGKSVYLGYIQNHTNEFTVTDLFYYGFSFPGETGGHYTIVIEKIGDTVILYDSWDKYVSPDWPKVVDYMFAPMDEGEYLLKAIKNNEVIATGRFYINKYNFDFGIFSNKN